MESPYESKLRVVLHLQITSGTKHTMFYFMHKYPIRTQFQVSLESIFTGAFIFSLTAFASLELRFQDFMPGINFSSMLFAQALWYLLNQTNQFYCGPDHLVLMKNPLFLACTFSSTEFTGSRPDAAASLKGQTVTFLSHFTFLPTAA